MTGLKSHVLVPLTSFETLKLKMKLKYSLNSFVKLSREEAVVSVIFFFLYLEVIYPGEVFGLCFWRIPHFKKNPTVAQRVPLHTADKWNV